MNPKPRSSHPNRKTASRDLRALFDWMAQNGVDEYLPEHPKVKIVDGALTYWSFVWDGPRGFKGEGIAVHPTESDALYEWRTVPLIVNPPAEVMEWVTT